MTFADDAVAALERVTAALPAGEIREGQRQMTIEVAEAIQDGRHLIVQAGTGTGKSIAYLIPAILSGKRTVIATATKALQDQLASKDLPFLAEHLDDEFSFAVLKGRSNYVCLQRLHEATTSDLQLGLGLDGANADADDGGESAPPVPNELVELLAWVGRTDTGDRADLETEPAARTWNAVSVGPRECPGATNCSRGAECFAERARAAAAKADVVVVNTHLYGIHLASAGGVLPEHELVVIDEAHQLEDTVSATAAVELNGGRVSWIARNTQAILADPQMIADVYDAADKVATVLGEHLGQRLKPMHEADILDVLTLVRGRVEKVMEALRAIPDDAPNDAKARKQRAMQAASVLVDDIGVAQDRPPGTVAWVEGFADAPVMKVAPIDVAPLLSTTLFEKTTAILTSATIPPRLAERLDLAEDRHHELDVGSPFDYESQALLYCAKHLPDPRHATFDEAMQRELEQLIIAAGGRTLALFTSYRAMTEAAAALKMRLPWNLYTQNDLPKPVLVQRFKDDEESCLFATMSFWQGIDVPGRALSLVTIDRLPFPRPDEPLLQARREAARAEAFRTVDLPRASTLLAQGAGRLIRSSSDRGVVAVFDPRLATNKHYRWDIVSALPPMRRTSDRAEAEAFLRELRDGPR